MFELSQSFYFEAAHTLRRQVERNEADGSRRVHGHTYSAEVCVQGEVDPASGMVVDLAVLRAAIAAVRDRLDHHFLDEVPGLGVPTLENLCRYIHAQVAAAVPDVASVMVERKSSGDRCVYRPASGDGSVYRPASGDGSVYRPASGDGSVYRPASGDDDGGDALRLLSGGAA